MKMEEAKKVCYDGSVWGEYVSMWNILGKMNNITTRTESLIVFYVLYYQPIFKLNSPRHEVQLPVTSS